MVLNKFKLFYFQIYVLLLFASCNGMENNCEMEGEIFDGELIEFNTEKDWSDIIDSKQIIVIDNFYSGRRWADNTYIFRSDDFCSYNIQMSSIEAKKIKSLYEYQWQTNQTTLSRKYRIYAEVDSVKYLGLENSGLGMGSKFGVYGRMICLYIDAE